MSNPNSEALEAEVTQSSPCVACRLPLPIRPVPANDVGQQWFCSDCGTKHFGVLLDGAPPAIAAHVKPANANATAAHNKTGKALPPRGPMYCDVETPASKELDAALGTASNLLSHSVGPSFLSSTTAHKADPYSAEAIERFSRECEESAAQVETLIESLEQGKPFDLEATEAITRDSLVKAAEDLDLFVHLGINPVGGQYPSSHCLHVAMLAASVGAKMGWDTETLVELGIGCLLHDSGMIRVPQECYNTDRVLDEGEFIEIIRHPLYTFDLLADKLDQVPLTSRMVAFQIHERCDGSGYPRNRHGEQIHEASKVAAVADVYLALVSARPHRPALMPYLAVEHLLYEVKRGAIDSGAVRALLRTISLFPIGSYLRLSNGMVARVIRANNDNFGRPVVEAWLHDNLDAAPKVVDLSSETEIKVVSPLPRLAAA